MHKYEVYHKNEGIGPHAPELWGKDSAFDYAVFEPHPPFAFGKLAALFFKKEQADRFAAGMNALLASPCDGSCSGDELGDCSHVREASLKNHVPVGPCADMT